MARTPRPRHAVPPCGPKQDAIGGSQLGLGADGRHSGHVERLADSPASRDLVEQQGAPSPPASIPGAFPLRADRARTSVPGPHATVPWTAFAGNAGQGAPKPRQTFSWQHRGPSSEPPFHSWYNPFCWFVAMEPSLHYAGSVQDSVRSSYGPRGPAAGSTFATGFNPAHSGKPLRRPSYLATRPCEKNS